MLRAQPSAIGPIKTHPLSLSLPLRYCFRFVFSYGVLRMAVFIVRVKARVNGGLGVAPGLGLSLGLWLGFGLGSVLGLGLGF